jgi:uncharacterized protein (DUF1800 family)
MKRICFYPVGLGKVSWLALSLLAAPCLVENLPAQQTAATDASPIAKLLNAAPTAFDVAFLTKKTRLWLDRSQIVCFYVRQASDEDRFFSFNVDENFVHVLNPPALLAGSHIGYVRLRPLAEGKTQIRLDGAELDVDIVKDTSASTLDQTRPEIISPDENAVVWGKFAVGVEQFNLATDRELTPPVLRLPDGQEIAAHIVPNQEPGPHVRYVFTVDAATLHPGANDLIAVVKKDSGREVVSEPVEIFAINPDPSAIVTGYCKDMVNTQLPPLPPPPPGVVVPPPKPFVPPTVSPDALGVFGSIVVNPADNTPWCMPVTVPTKGQYQFIMTARGDIGGNALPTLALFVDRAQTTATAGRLATTEWQRVAVGKPVNLDPGPHILSVRFRNPFAPSAIDRRCLYLARYELVRLDAPAGPGGGGDAMMMMQGGSPATMQPTTAQSTSAQTNMMQEASSMAPKAPPPPAMPGALPAGLFHVVFKNALDGRVISGPVQVNAMCWWPNRDHAPPPTVNLLVNDAVVATQKNAQPQFHVAVAAFRPGENKIQLRAALDNGMQAHSVTENIVLPNTPVGAPYIAYPAEGAKVGWADAVVANVSPRDDRKWLDLQVDGQPQHLNLNPRGGLGPVLFPLLTRGLAPGPHQVQVVEANKDGTSQTSNPVNVTVTGKAHEPNGPYTRALFLLNRFGYGPDARELATILTVGPHDWLSAQLGLSIDAPTEDNEDERLHAEFPNPNSVTARAIQYLLTDSDPVRARFVMWTENHFSTWLSKDGAPEKAREHDRFLDLGVAPFPDLLLASATSPAMLLYLDQRNSVAKRLNENYAREIMELHTLGVKGGYTQQDVTTLADLLTGWTVADEAPLDGLPSATLARTFRYDPYLNSGNPCRILGMEFPGVPVDRRFDRVLTALNMLSAHPSCAYFISRKLIEHYVSDPAPPDLVDNIAEVYLQTGGDMRAMLLALSEQPAFWSAPMKVASPIDFSVRLARLSGQANPTAALDLVSHSGMGIFDRATPDGYPDADGYFTSSNALLQRWHFAQAVENNFLVDGLIPDAWRPADTQWSPATTQRLVDIAAVRITGNVLSPNSNDAALKLIAAAPANTPSRLHLLATFLCQVPETSIR